MTTTKTRKTHAYDTALNTSDETTPALAIQRVGSAVLAAIARGAIDAAELARHELAARGLDAHGNWIGYTQG